MRSIFVFAMFTVSLANAAGDDDYQEVRNLNLGASGISALEVEAGAGSLEIIGVSGTNEIVVTATILVPEDDADKAREKINSHLVLSLEKKGNRAVLTGYFKDGFMNFGDSPLVQLEVRVPQELDLIVDGGPALAGSTIVVDCTVEGMLHAPELPRILKGGARLMIEQGVLKNPEVEAIFCAPGNPGIAALADCVPIDPTGIVELADFADKSRKMGGAGNGKDNGNDGDTESRQDEPPKSGDKNANLLS